LEFVKKQRVKLKRQEKENAKLKQDAEVAEKALEEAKASKSENDASTNADSTQVGKTRK
jgi:hypothetical protein